MKKEKGTDIINGKIIDWDKISIEELEKLKAELEKKEAELQKKIDESLQ